MKEFFRCSVVLSVEAVDSFLNKQNEIRRKASKKLLVVSSIPKLFGLESSGYDLGKNGYSFYVYGEQSKITEMKKSVKE
jgi:hypothetical protein